VVVRTTNFAAAYGVSDAVYRRSFLRAQGFNGLKTNDARGQQGDTDRANRRK
jgi:hypothetical protein